ncbi:MAG TPA: SPOR domain-containing protein [Longimicrobiales bacterium]|nr:SPOR domain-containing protein [Longimicrobiales bacterium]
MSLRVWPTAMPLDPDSAGLPAELRTLVSQTGAVTPVVLLVAGPAARASGWAARAAVALAEAWARGGRRVVLADLSIGESELDPGLAIAGDEGAVDLFLFGASLPHLLRRPDGRAFEYLPAGVAPAEPGEVLGHPRWRQVIADAFRTGTSLLVYTPAAEPGLRELAGRIASAIVLAGSGDTDAVAAALPEDAAVLAVLAPEMATAEPAGGPPPAIEPSAAAGAAEPLTEAELASIPGPGSEPAAPEPVEEVEPVDAIAAAEAVVGAEPAGFEDWTADLLASPGESGPVEETGPTADEGTAAAPAAEAFAAAAEPERLVAEAEASGEAPTRREGEAAPTDSAEPAAVERREPEPPSERRIDEGAHPAGEHSRDLFVDAVWARRNAAHGAEPPPAPPVDPVPGREVTDEELLAEPPVAQPAEPPGRRRGAGVIVSMLIGAAVMLGILYAVRWYFFRPEPPAAPARPAVAPPPAPPRPTSDSLPYSVAIAAYPQYARAVQRTTELAAEQPGITFFVSPVMMAGALRYQVLAGPVADSAGAAILMRRLLDAGIKTGSSQFDVRPTRLAFQLGEFETREAAVAKGQQLATQNIPTYVVEVPFTAGPARYRLYAGAFVGAAEADVMRPLLRGAGAPDSLVLRVGRSTQ